MQSQNNNKPWLNQLYFFSFWSFSSGANTKFPVNNFYHIKSLSIVLSFEKICFTAIIPTTSGFSGSNLGALHFLKIYYFC